MKYKSIIKLDSSACIVPPILELVPGISVRFVPLLNAQGHTTDVELFSEKAFPNTTERVGNVWVWAGVSL